MFKFIKALFLGAMALASVSLTGTVSAATSVSWLSPPDGSTYAVGTSVTPTGVASGVSSGGSGTGSTGLDLVLVIDVSGSMYGGNITAAKNAANALVAALPAATTSVGIVKFNSSASPNVPLGLTPVDTGLSQITAAINGLSTGGGTNLGAGVAAGATTLISGHTPGRTMMQVVISDGYGAYSNQAATAYANDGIITHTVGIPGHDTTLMSTIANDGQGVYTSVSDLSTLTALFSGTGGNLVGLQRVDVTLPDGTVLSNVSTNGLGHFSVGPYVLTSGANVFTALAVGTDGTQATSTLTLYGQAPGGGSNIPEPANLLLLGLGLIGMMGARVRGRRS